MKIVVDARFMGAKNTRGIGRYIEEMTEQMQVVKKDEDSVVCARPEVKWYGWQEQWRMPWELGKYQGDVVWIPHWNASVIQPKPFVITIHDLLLMHQPASAQASTRGKVHAWIKRLGYKIVLNIAVRRAAKILVPTQAVAEDVKFFFPRAENKLQVTGEGLTKLPQPLSKPSSIQTPYLLYVGSAYPHKSLDLLIDAWQTICTRDEKKSLVIAGKEDAFLEKIKQLVHQKRIPRVLFIGQIDDQELATLYANAEAFVFPSQFEGFGLPPVEALGHGTPVIASDINVLQEVLPKEGVFFFKAGQKDDMIRVIESVLTDRSKAVHEAVLGAAIVRDVHRWDKAAAVALQAIRSVVHHH